MGPCAFPVLLQTYELLVSCYLNWFDQVNAMVIPCIQLSEVSFCGSFLVPALFGSIFCSTVWQSLPQGLRAPSLYSLCLGAAQCMWC